MDKITFHLCFRRLVGLASLVSLAADVGWVGQISEVTYVPEGRTPARHACAGGLHALPGIPLVTDINPGETHPLLLLLTRGVLLLLPCAAVGRRLRPGAVKRGPVGGQLTRGQESQGVPPPVRIRKKKSTNCVSVWAGFGSLASSTLQ